jgi:hypothetical protein
MSLDWVDVVAVESVMIGSAVASGRAVAGAVGCPE